MKYILTPSVIDKMPYKFVWMSKMGYKETLYISLESYWLKKYEDSDLK